MSKKESAVDLARLVDKPVRVKLAGGREVTGTLRGYDQLMNLVIDETAEYLRDSEDHSRITDDTRQLGLVVCRGPSVMLVAPTSGTEEIQQNPFTSGQEEI
ncbi:hypothetical protein BSKO_05308 [Bryopsis sp. KO-2023]|nr:hypothetical protein BSKO_05308 [Bryopsis sp. KO-2023]